MRTTSLLFLVSSFSLSFAQTTPSVVQLLDLPQLSSLKAAILQYPDIVSTLSAAKDITVLAPSNDAFAKLSAAPDADTLKNILTYHVLKGTFPSTAFSAKPAFAPTLLGEVAAYRNISGADQVVKGVVDAGKVKIFSGLNQASEVVTADAKFTGGVAHIIDTVLALPQSASKTASALGFSSLVDALVSAGLAGTVDSLAKVTIFAPTNAAFSAIKTPPSKEELAKILTYHVVPGVVGFSTGLKNGQKLKTVQGNELTVTVNKTGVFIDNAKVAVPDVIINSGVVHAIDSVLIPKKCSGREFCLRSRCFCLPSRGAGGH